MEAPETGVEAEPATGSAPPDGVPPMSTVAVILVVALVLVSVVVVALVYLWAYGTGRFRTPIGFDTPQYIWRANLVRESGLGSLVGWAPPGLKVNGDRTGLLIFAAVTDGMREVSPYQLMFSLPAIASVVVAMAAGAFAVAVLEEPWWAFGAYAVGVGASTNMARMAVGSHDNSFVMGILVAFALVALLAAAGRPAVVASALLFGGAMLTHWRFALLFASMFLALGILLAPTSLKRWRKGEPALSTPTARLGLVIGAGAALGAAAFALVPESPVRGFASGSRIREEKLSNKSASRLPPLRLPITAPAAALGAISLWWPKSALRRWSMVLLVMWGASLAPAFVAYYWLDQPIPVYRVAAFALAIPMLAVALLVSITRLLESRLGAIGAIAGGLLIVSSLSWAATAAQRTWDKETALMSGPRVLAMARAASYIEMTAEGRPIIFLASTPQLIPTLRQVYAGVPPPTITRTRVFVGSLDDLRAGRPTTTASTLLRPSRVTLAGARELLDDDPLILYLDEFNPRLPPPSDAVSIAPGVSVVGGPLLRIDATSPSVDAWSLATTAGSGVLMLWVIGLGWSWSLVPTGWLGRATIAPAFGAAVLALAGTVTDSFGLGFSFAGSTWLVVLAAAVGWAPGLWRLSRRL